MSWFQDLLDECYDIWSMYCKDCDRKFKTKRRGFLSDGFNTIDKSCLFCGSANTKRLPKATG